MQYTRQDLMAMPLRLVRLLDIRDGELEKLVQEVVDARLQVAPPEGTVYRRDIPDIRDGETEKKWQKIIDARTEALRPRSLRMDEATENSSETPIEPSSDSTETPEELPTLEESISEEAIEEAGELTEEPVETPTESPETIGAELSGKFCESCNGKKAHKVYCIKR